MSKKNTKKRGTAIADHAQSKAGRVLVMMKMETQFEHKGRVFLFPKGERITDQVEAGLVRIYANRTAYQDLEEGGDA